MNETATKASLYQWASPHGSHGMATIAALEKQGFVKVAQDWRYGAWLMKREAK